jgi:hypothetical protein
MRTRAGVALVVVHPSGRHVLPVHVTIVQVVDVIGVHDGVVATARSVGVPVGLGLAVFDGGHLGWSLRRYPVC